MTRLHLHVYNKNERGGPWWKTAQWTLGTTLRGKYHGSLLKGWWRLGPWKGMEYLELELALGGEDNMAQFSVHVPWIGLVSAGVRVPRSWTRSWVYHRREWGIRIGYVGRWAELRLFDDSHIRDTGMVSYYRGLRDRGEEVNWTRAQTWPGWHLTLRPRLRDRLFGRMECVTTTGEPEPVVIPMPEGNYPGTMRREDRVWKRKRWPWIARTRSDYWIEMQVGVPTPGKGENSWDIDDDAIFGAGGSTPAEAIANVTKAALRERERHGGKGWVPTDGWPEGVAR